jgi:hypothetical protein
MHLDVKIPSDLAPLISQGEGAWTKFFVTLGETMDACQSVGFEIMEADDAPDALLWWQEYACYDPGCRADPEGEPRTIQVVDGRGLSFGYVIARKPVGT